MHVEDAYREELVTYNCRSKYYEHNRRYSHDRAIAGAVIGGIIGRNLSSRNRNLNTIAGAVAGGAIGHSLDEKYSRSPYRYYGERRYNGRYGYCRTYISRHIGYYVTYETVNGRYYTRFETSIP